MYFIIEIEFLCTSRVSKRRCCITFFLVKKNKYMWECYGQKNVYWHIVLGKYSGDWFTWCRQIMRNNNILLFLALWLQRSRGNWTESDMVLCERVVDFSSIIHRLRSFVQWNQRQIRREVKVSAKRYWWSECKINSKIVRTHTVPVLRFPSIIMKLWTAHFYDFGSRFNISP